MNDVTHKKSYRTVAKLEIIHMGRNLTTDLSRLEVIRPREMTPLEMITACLCFRIQETVRNRLISYSRAVHTMSFLEH